MRCLFIRETWCHPFFFLAVATSFSQFRSSLALNRDNIPDDNSSSTQDSIDSELSDTWDTLYDSFSDCDIDNEDCAPPWLPPPPPVPPSMDSFVKELVENNNGAGVCELCAWAQQNYTDGFIPGISDSPSESSWVPILVLVALGSALAGAAMMILILKCRRFRILPTGESCPVFPISHWGHKEQTERPETASASTNKTPPQSTNGALTIAPSSSSVGWRLWRRNASPECPLRSPPQSEENSYCEEPYSSAIMADSGSAVYAELNSVASSSVPHRTYSTYSEIPEPSCGNVQCANELRRLFSDGTYENAAYVIDGPIDSSTGTASTPSSAYYSDLSSTDNRHYNREALLLCHQHMTRKRKKERTEDGVRDLMPVHLDSDPDNLQAPDSPLLLSGFHFLESSRPLPPVPRGWRGAIPPPCRPDSADSKCPTPVPSEYI